MSDEKVVARRTVLKTLGAYAVVPLVHGIDATGLWAIGDVHPRVPPQEAGPWRPRYLTDFENETVTALSDRIIPATDTPGAAAAKVNQYIDWALSQAPVDDQRAFRAGLGWIDADSDRRYGRRFIDLDSSTQDELLTPLAQAADGADRTAAAEPGPAFFADLKQRTIEGYYRSEVGMRLELGYEGNTFLTEFEGCTHAEHLDWEPGSDLA